MTTARRPSPRTIAAFFALALCLAHARSIPAQTGPLSAPEPSALIDRAAAELATLSPGGVDTSVLFGVPSLDERRRAEEAAHRALRLLSEAASAVDAAVRRAEEGTMGRDAADAEAPARAGNAEARLTQLIDVEQAQRLPFYRAQSLVLLAAASVGQGRADSARQALELLRPLRLPGPAADASRQLAIIAALLNGGRPEPGDPGPAEARLRLTAIDPAHPDQVSAIRIALARRILDPASVDPASTPAELEADARALAAQARAVPAGPRRNELVAAACAKLLALPRSSGPAARLAIYGKLAAIIEPGVDTASLPVEAAFARAITLMRSTPDSIEARALLSQVATRADAPPALRTDAAWEAAAALLRVAEADPDAQLRALDPLDRFISDHPADPRALDAALSVLALSARLGADSRAGDAAHSDARRLKALDLLLSQQLTGPAAEEWRAAAASVRIRQLDPRTLTPAQVRPISALLEGSSSPAAVKSLLAVVRSAIDDPSWSARPAPERLDLLDAARTLSPAKPDDRMALAAGLAKAELRRPDAASELRPLIGGPLDQPDQPTRAPLRLTLAHVLAQSAPTRPEAVTLLRELAQPFDQPGAQSPRPDFYWQAWAAMLELTGDQGEALRAQVKRLEIIDPALGGPATSERIRRTRDAPAPAK